MGVCVCVCQETSEETLRSSRQNTTSDSIMLKTPADEVTCVSGECKQWHSGRTARSSMLTTDVNSEHVDDEDGYGILCDLLSGHKNNVGSDVNDVGSCGMFRDADAAVARVQQTNDAEMPDSCDEESGISTEPTDHAADKTAACSTCSQFNSASFSANHKCIYSGLKPHNCGICHKPCSDQGAVRAHRRMRVADRPYVCYICTKAFVKPRDFMRHISAHSGDRERPHACDVCQKAFADKETLRKHKRVHTGARPYECYICLKAFFDSSDLMRHIRLHTDDKPHVCAVCRMRFVRFSDLDKHMITHTGEKRFACELCRKQFTQSGSLNRHLLAHAGVKPHECDLCQMRFTDRRDLRRHQLTHTGERPHECDVCHKRFTRHSYLKSHLLVIHGSQATQM